MRSLIDSRKAHILAGFAFEGCADEDCAQRHRRLPALRQVCVTAAAALLCTPLLGIFALAPGNAIAQDNMPPEMNAPIVRSPRPKRVPPVSPAAPLVAPSSTSAQAPAATPGATPGAAQSMAQRSPAASATPRSHRRGAPPNAVRPQPEPAPPAPTAPVSLLQLPANHAQVHVSPGHIAIQSDNSSLSQVLHDIGAATGMKVEGLTHDERVFGNYGPGAPRDVLSALLEGAGYNVLMVGEMADGAPRQLILSQKNGTSAPTTAAAATQPPEEEEAEPDQGGQDTETLPAEAQPVPPPVQNPNATPGSEVKTPQQLLEQLQRMRQDQQQEQPPPQQ
ncbi:MAG TPA: hypothetical protein VM554_15935 [Acidisarcina sp.]|nr:hypothetical protein [Acidisarcina sp.]